MFSAEFVGSPLLSELGRVAWGWLTPSPPPTIPALWGHWMPWFPRRGSWEGEQTRPPSTAREAQGNFLPKWSLTSKGRLSGDYLSTGSRLAGCATCTQGRNHLLLSLLKKKSNKNNPTLYFLYQGDGLTLPAQSWRGLGFLTSLASTKPFSSEVTLRKGWSTVKSENPDEWSRLPQFSTPAWRQLIVLWPRLTLLCSPTYAHALTKGFHSIEILALGYSDVLLNRKLPHVLPSPISKRMINIICKTLTPEWPWTSSCTALGLLEPIWCYKKKSSSS